MSLHPAAQRARGPPEPRVGDGVPRRRVNIGLTRRGRGSGGVVGADGCAVLPGVVGGVDGG
jgi:hypothetical protein